MKRILLIATALITVSSCAFVDDGAGVSNTLSIGSVSAGGVKSVVEGPEFPDECARTGLGLFLKMSDGSAYDGSNDGKLNVKCSDEGLGWKLQSPVLLSGTKGVLYGYYPYSSSVSDFTKVPVSSSLDGVDYMYAVPVENVSSANSMVNLQLKHALARITVRFVKDGEYPGAGVVSALSISGSKVARTGTLDLRTGAVTASTGSISFTVPDAVVTESGYNAECLVVPASGSGSTVTLSCVIDGRTFSSTVSGVDVQPGVKSVITVLVKNLGISVANVNVSGYNDLSVTVNGKKVNVGLSQDVIDNDIILAVSASGSSAVINAVTKSGNPLEVISSDANCVCDGAKDAGGMWSFTVSGMTGSTTALTVGYDVVKMARTDVMEQGFYKEMFIDGGIGLTPGENLVPQATKDLYGTENDEWMNHVEYCSAGSSQLSIQQAVMCGTSEDLNGVLLYPDGEPRFKYMYGHGGKSSTHAEALGQSGIEHVQTFYANGGSFTSSCASTFLTGSHYLLLDGGTTPSSGMNLGNTYYTDVTLTGDCQRFLDILGMQAGTVLDSIRHNGGPTLNEDSCPPGVEILARYSSRAYPEENVGEHSNLDQCLYRPVMWAYKRSAQSGRVVSCGSHPEGCYNSRAYALYKAQIQYAEEGAGCATPKAALRNGETRVMNLHEGDPAHCGIGDGQYHHYVIYLPKDAATLKLTLNWETDARLQLALKRDSYAFLNSVSDEYKLLSPNENAFVSSNKPSVLTFNNVRAGLWYVSVYCNEKPDWTKVNYYFKYSGQSWQMAALNGIPYTISATWTY